MRITLDRLKKFADVLHAGQLAMLVRQGTDCQPNRDNCAVNVIPGKKYTKVNVGGSGKYMVVNDTSEIFGIKAYGVIHRGHAFGTLDTLDDFDWAHYRAQRIRIRLDTPLPPTPPANRADVVERTLTDSSAVYDVDVIVEGRRVATIGCPTQNFANALALTINNAGSIS